jgi:hypothetical protein
MAFFATEDIVGTDALGHGYLKYAIGEEVTAEDAEANEDSVVEDPAAPVPVSSVMLDVYDDTSGLVVGDTVDGRKKVLDGDTVGGPVTP